MDQNSRFQVRGITESVLGVLYGVLVFAAVASFWNYAVGLFTFFSLAHDPPPWVSSGIMLRGKLLAFVPSALLSGLACWVAWKMAGKRAGIVAAAVSLAAVAAGVAFVASRHWLYFSPWWGG